MGTAEVMGAEHWLGGSWGHPQGWGVPRLGGTHVPLHLGCLGGWAVSPLRSHPSQARVTPHCPKCPLRSVGTPGSAAAPVSPHGWGQVGVRGDPKTGRVVPAPNGL